jgi:CubicO group peptidase (beta-lactamase class C family)
LQRAGRPALWQACSHWGVYDVGDGREAPARVSYVPAPGTWEARPPAALGLRAEALEAAIAYHRTHESGWARDFLTKSGRFIGVAGEADDSEVLGPIRPRKDPNGLIVRGGYVVAEWGDTERVDMSFSIAKSYLAILAGLAVARGLIRDIDVPVRDSGLDDSFDSIQNRTITWRHLLQQTSEWQGVLWDKADTIDHNRDLAKSDFDPDKGCLRPLRPPGTLWEYNDVRVNRLSLSLLQLFRRPLADVLREAVMGPIGASDDWSWEPYRNSWIECDGRRVPSVPGGSHWGGGLWMSSRDHARVGLLVHRQGLWGGRRLLDPGWLAELRRPCPLNPQYGLMWWLNTGRVQFPSAPETVYAARGAGSNLIWIDPEHDLVVVVRWIDKASMDGFARLVLDSVSG